VSDEAFSAGLRRTITIDSVPPQAKPKKRKPATATKRSSSELGDITKSISIPNDF
jgi:hypothetical protein